MRTFTTQSQRAAMVPSQVRTLLALFNTRTGFTDARVAGGAVRDALLDVTPKDWDVATTLSPPDVERLATAAGLAVIPTGLQHGTITVVVDGMPIEVTTLREDTDTDGRHAIVTFTTDWKVDAERRDLTMNAMFMHVDGTVDDFFGGMDDLSTGTVRFVGNAADRIQEDFLRILRFFRFAGRMHVNHFDSEALRAVKRNANGLCHISGERVWMELSKILTGTMLRDVLERMEHAMVFSSLGFSKVNVDHAVMANDMGAKAETVLAALLDNPDAVAKATDDWKLSRTERKTAMFVASHTHDRVRVEQWSLMTWKKMVVAEGRDLALELLSLTDHTDWRHNVLPFWTVPVLPLTGQDILDMGVAPGPEVGRRLSVCKTQWFDSDFTLPRDKLLQLASLG